MSSWLLSVLSMLVAAIVGSYLTLAKFKKERMWQERYEAAKEVISAFENIRFWAEETICAVNFHPTNGFPDGKKPYEYLTDALRKLDYYTVAGSILFSESFVKEIKALNHDISLERFEFNDDKSELNEREVVEDLINHAGRIREMIDAKLPEIIRMAKNEL